MNERAAYTIVGHEPRVIVGLFLQPFVSFLLGFAVFPLVDYTSRLLDGGRAGDMLDGAIAFGMGTGMVGLLVTIFGASPALVWLLSRGTVTRRYVLVAGVVLGAAPGLVALAAWAARGSGVSGGMSPSYWLALAVRAIAIGCLIGAAGAAVFWLVARSRIDEERT